MKRRAMLIAIATALLVTGCDLFQADERPPQYLTFASTRDFDTLENAGEIYVMNLDGTDQRRITQNNVDDRQPNLSPDGKRIVFSRGAPNADDQEIYVMNVDGSDEIRLTNNNANDQMPVFSPNGKQIAFMSTRDGNPQIYVMNADGTRVRRITEHAGADQYPSWSPNGKQIVFSRDGDIYVVNADGSGVKQLTSDPAFEYKPSWSQNGKRIAFAAFVGDQTTPFYHEIWSMNEDGSNVRVLTPLPDGVAANEWDNRWPVWSKDGKHIYFQSVRPASVKVPDSPHPLGFEIFRMDADGSNPINLTQTFGVDATPDVR